MKEGTRGEENMIIHVYKMMRREVERRRWLYFHKMKRREEKVDKK
jgi:hypothetical protein